MLQYESAAPHPSRVPSANAAPPPAPTTELGSTASYFLWRALQNSRDDVRHAVPLFRFGLQFALARRRQPVIFRLALVFRLAPFAGDPALMLQPIQRRIQRALLNLQAIFRNLLDAKQNAVAEIGRAHVELQSHHDL